VRIHESGLFCRRFVTDGLGADSTGCGSNICDIVRDGRRGPDGGVALTLASESDEAEWNLSSCAVSFVISIGVSVDGYVSVVGSCACVNSFVRSN
jgi:hypothetical protein